MKKIKALFLLLLSTGALTCSSSSSSFVSDGSASGRDDSSILDSIEGFIDRIERRSAGLPGFEDHDGFDFNKQPTPSGSFLVQEGKRSGGEMAIQDLDDLDISAVEENSEEEEEKALEEMGFRVDRAHENFLLAIESMPVSGRTGKLLRQARKIKLANKDLSTKIERLDEIKKLLNSCFEELEKEKKQANAKSQRIRTRISGRRKEEHKRLAAELVQTREQEAHRADARNAREENAAKGRHLLKTGSAKDLAPSGNMRPHRRHR